ncbi:Auxin-induced protein [Macleaya cordata]|uniref:Auxin-induced protein n=1 Tax=Macleaya cordata TaxID=56857 RepID=A0A200R975_MACCD|nr:Auxin-induced protein [Macleaya cordata]
MDSKKSNKISEIVRLQQILKKWRKIANAPKNTTTSSSSSSSTTTTTTKKFLKKTLSFKDISVSAAPPTDVVPKGFLAVCVGKEMKRFIIPTDFLGHRAFEILLREAEEEFGFQHEGALRIPCEVSVFERILKMVEEKKEVFFINEFGFNGEKEKNIGCCSSQAELTHSIHPHNPMCR